jgi:hypothetical protein
MKFQANIIERPLRRVVRVALNWITWKLDGIYDYRHGTDTSSFVQVKELSAASKNLKNAGHYEPSSPFLFKTIMNHLSVDYNEYVFIDIGSGKGRILILASDYPFAEVIGIEFSPQLHAIAESNLINNEHRRASKITLLCADVADYEFSNNNTVLYLFNPFNRVMILKLLDKLRYLAEHNKIYMVYSNALHSDIVEKAGIFKTTTRVKVPYLVRKTRNFSDIFIYSNV